MEQIRQKQQPDDFINSVCRVLKLTAAASIAFALCLTKSKYHELSNDALNFIKRRLPELKMSPELTEDIVQALLLYVSSKEVGEF